MNLHIFPIDNNNNLKNEKKDKYTKKKKQEELTPEEPEEQPIPKRIERFYCNVFPSFSKFLF
jgi:hypothetical protein